MQKRQPGGAAAAGHDKGVGAAHQGRAVVRQGQQLVPRQREVVEVGDVGARRIDDDGGAVTPDEAGDH